MYLLLKTIYLKESKINKKIYDFLMYNNNKMLEIIIYNENDLITSNIPNLLLTNIIQDMTSSYMENNMLDKLSLFSKKEFKEIFKYKSELLPSYLDINEKNEAKVVYTDISRCKVKNIQDKKKEDILIVKSNNPIPFEVGIYYFEIYLHKITISDM